MSKAKTKDRMPSGTMEIKREQKITRRGAPDVHSDIGVSL